MLYTRAFPTTPFWGHLYWDKPGGPRGTIEQVSCGMRINSYSMMLTPPAATHCVQKDRSFRKNYCLLIWILGPGSHKQSGPLHINSFFLLQWSPMVVVDIEYDVVRWKHSMIWGPAWLTLATNTTAHRFGGLPWRQLCPLEIHSRVRFIVHLSSAHLTMRLANLRFALDVNYSGSQRWDNFSNRDCAFQPSAECTGLNSKFISMLGSRKRETEAALNKQLPFPGARVINLYIYEFIQITKKNL